MNWEGRSWEGLGQSTAQHAAQSTNILEVEQLHKKCKQGMQINTVQYFYLQNSYNQIEVQRREERREREKKQFVARDSIKGDDKSSDKAI